MQDENLTKIPTQGVHHITLVGASRKISIDFWQGILGMPFIFEQPNLDNPMNRIFTLILVMAA